ncbi:hypothetical protein ACJX0J_031669, partial [Zea mays]
VWAFMQAFYRKEPFLIKTYTTLLGFVLSLQSVKTEHYLGSRIFILDFLGFIIETTINPLAAYMEVIAVLYLV